MGISKQEYKTKYLKKTKRKPYDYKESALQTQVIELIRNKYKGVRVVHTKNEGKKIGGQLRRVKSEGIGQKGFPDLTIYGSSKCGRFSTLYIELKKETPYIKGKLKSGQHLKDQREWIMCLRSLGLLAGFMWEFKEIEKLLHNYFLNKDFEWEYADGIIKAKS